MNVEVKISEIQTTVLLHSERIIGKIPGVLTSLTDTGARG